MKSNKIKKIFKQQFNNLPNPIFQYPLLYFKHKNYLCEVASGISDFNSNKLKYNCYKNPLYILEGLFVTELLFVTVLEIMPDKSVKTTDLSGIIENINYLPKFIYTKLK